MNRTVSFIKHEPMLCISLLAAAAGLIITPPSAAFLGGIDWRTLGNLLMMLCVLEGFKRERILRPVENLAKRLRSMFALSLFLIFGVFFTSMFVTNDVSLIIFVPLTISLFRSAGREKYILPVISMENIAAVRGSLLTPFGSPQNMFLYGQAREINFRSFAAHMSPLAAMSAVLLVLFVLVLYRKNLGEVIDFRFDGEEWKKDRRAQRAVYLILFALVILVIVTRTRLWWAALIAVAAAIFTADRSIFGKVDYVLVVTFLCFFIFSSSVAGNAGISAFLSRSVARREYWWAIGLSQIISNVPATIVLYPFSSNHAALIYGADTAGLCSLIGSLASVINYRIYVREYPGNGGKFIKTFTLISWAFFAFVVLPGYFISRAWLF